MFRLMRSCGMRRLSAISSIKCNLSQHRVAVHQANAIVNFSLAQSGLQNANNHIELESLPVYNSRANERGANVTFCCEAREGRAIICALCSGEFLKCRTTLPTSLILGVIQCLSHRRS